MSRRVMGHRVEPIAEMDYLDFTLATPAENLACDEALLDWAEEQGGPAGLRFWESRQHFVVLGYGNKLREQVRIAECQAAGVPILRRCSGGGTVLQGPGCLNYSLILRIEEDTPWQSIAGTNRLVMERNRDALSALLGQPVSVEGSTDLAVNGLKFSGNAQRRKRHWLLFHGTFLLDFDLELIAKLLLPPPRQPAYRHNRSHLEFLTKLKLSAESTRGALRKAWRATKLRDGVPHEEIARLVKAKYSKEEWNLKW